MIIREDTAQSRYDRKHKDQYKRYSLKFGLTNPDNVRIVEKLDSVPNRQEYLRNLILADLGYKESPTEVLFYDTVHKERCHAEIMDYSPTIDKLVSKGVVLYYGETDDHYEIYSYKSLRFDPFGFFAIKKE